MFHIRRLFHRSFALCVVAMVLVPWSSAVHGQSDADRAAAQALFDEAQELKEAGENEKACKKFEASRALDPAPGTKLNLAACYEEMGRTASAWVNFIEVAQAKDGDERRAAFALERADALKPRLTRLRIEVVEPVDGMVVKRGDEDVSKATWGALVPVDPDTYEISARAPGKLLWRETIEVEGEGAEIEIEIPSLVNDDSAGDDEPDDSDQPAEPDDGDSDGSGQFIAGAVVGGVGVVGVIIGVAFTSIAHSKYDESKTQCLIVDRNQCNDEGVALREEAQSAQTIYAASYALGGVAVVAGVITMLTAPSSGADEEADAKPDDDFAMVVAPLAAPGAAGIQLIGRF